MSPPNFQTALEEFFQVSEDLFQDWKRGTLSHESLWKGFSLEHCTEPYLFHRQGSSPLVFLTHNPGQPFPFQHLDQLSKPGSILQAADNYRNNEKRLTAYYQNENQTTAAAIGRVKRMIEFSQQLGNEGLLQVELFPLHSAKRPPDKYLFGNETLPEPFNRYRFALHNILERAPIVVALSGAAPIAGQRSVMNWLSLLGIPKAQPLILSEDKKSVGAFISSSPNSGLRILLCSQGNNVLPAQSRWSQILKAATQELSAHSRQNGFGPHFTREDL